MGKRPGSVNQPLYGLADCSFVALRRPHLEVTGLGTYSGSFDLSADWGVATGIDRYPDFALADGEATISSITASILAPRSGHASVIDAAFHFNASFAVS